MQFEDFCSSLTLAHCEAAQQCCTDAARRYSGLTDCVEQYEADCDLDYVVLDEPGTLRPAEFDPEAAGKELAKYRQSTQDCTAPYQVNTDELFESKAVGRACVLDDECPAGSVCYSDLIDSECHYIERAEGDTCRASEECGAAAYCAPRRHAFFADDDDDPETHSTNDDTDPSRLDQLVEPRVCVAGKRVEGSKCVRGECPRDLYCEGSVPDGESEYGWSKGECAERAGNGEPCFAHTDCASRVCSGGSDNSDWIYMEEADGRVVATSPVPGVCVACTPDDCGFNACEDGKCSLLTPRRDKADGASCEDDRECVSAWCVSGICLTPEANDLYCPN